MINTNEYTILNKIALNIIVVNKQMLLSKEALVDLKTQLGLKDIFVINEDSNIALNSDYQNSTLIAEDFKINKDIMISDIAAQTLKLRLGVTSEEDQIFVLNEGNEIVLNKNLSGEELNFEAASKTSISNLHVKNLLDLTQEVLDKLKIDLDIKKPIFIYTLEPKTISLDNEFQNSLLDLSNIASLKLLSLVEMKDTNIDFKNISTCNFDDLSKKNIKKGLEIQEIFKSEGEYIFTNEGFTGRVLDLDDVARAEIASTLIVNGTDQSITFKNKKVIFDTLAKKSFKAELDTLVLNATKDLYEIVDKKGLLLTQLTVDDIKSKDIISEGITSKNITSDSIISKEVNLSNESATLLLNQSIIDDIASRLPKPPDPPVVNTIFESDATNIFPKTSENNKTFDLKTLTSTELGTAKIHTSLQFADNTSKNAFKTHIDVPANILGVKSSSGYPTYIGLNSQYIVGVPILIETSGGQIKLSCGLDQTPAPNNRGPMFVEIDRLKITESMKLGNDYSTFFLIQDNGGSSKRIAMNPTDIYFPPTSTGPTKREVTFLINSKYTRIESEIRFVDKMHFEITDVDFNDVSKQKFRTALGIKDPVPPTPVDSIFIMGITPEYNPILYIDQKYIYPNNTLDKSNLMFLIESKYTRFNSLVTFVEPVSIESTKLKLQLTTFDIDTESKDNLRTALDIKDPIPSEDDIWQKENKRVTINPIYNELDLGVGRMRFANATIEMTSVATTEFQKALEFDKKILGTGFTADTKQEDPSLKRINLFDLSNSNYSTNAYGPGGNLAGYVTEQLSVAIQHLYKESFISDQAFTYHDVLNDETLRKLEELKKENIVGTVEQKVEKLIERVNLLTHNLNTSHLMFIYRLLDLLLFNGKMQNILDNILDVTQTSFKSAIQTNFKDPELNKKYHKQR